MIFPNNSYYYKIAIVSNHNETLIVFYNLPNTTSLIKI